MDRVFTFPARNNHADRKKRFRRQRFVKIDWLFFWIVHVEIVRWADQGEYHAVTLAVNKQLYFPSGCVKKPFETLA